MANLINGKEVSASVKSKVKNQTAELIEKSGITPGLAVVIVGNDPASRVYVNSKKKACSEVGFILMNMHYLKILLSRTSGTSRKIKL